MMLKAARVSYLSLSDKLALFSLNSEFFDIIFDFLFLAVSRSYNSSEANQGQSYESS